MRAVIFLRSKWLEIRSPMGNAASSFIRVEENVANAYCVCDMDAGLFMFLFPSSLSSISISNRETLSEKFKLSA